MTNTSRVTLRAVTKLSKACSRVQFFLQIVPTLRHCGALEILCRKGLLHGRITRHLDEGVECSSVTFNLSLKPQVSLTFN